MPSLLIVTEKFDVGGLETYIRGQVRAMARAGWRVFLACGGEPRPELLPGEIVASCRGLPLGGAANAAQLLHTTRALRQFIQAHGITHVHGHPFTSLFPALLAAKLEGVPYLATLHGPSSLNPGFGPCNDFLLGNLVLGLADRILAVSEEVRDLAAPYLEDGRLVVQVNAIDPEVFRPADAVDETARWLLVSRLDAFKIIGIRQFANHAHTMGLPGLDIAGDGPAETALREQLARDGLGDFVRFLGVRADIPELMRASAGVAGMGRVLLEGLASGRPCCLVGYDGAKGMVDPALFDAAAAANFSGRNLPNASVEELSRQLAHFEGKGDPALGRKVSSRHAEAVVWQKFADDLVPLLARPAPLLSDLYAVLESETVQADTTPYMQSGVFSYEMGRVIHGTRHFSPGLAAAYAFYWRHAQGQGAQWHAAANGQVAASLAEIRQELAAVREQADTLQRTLQERLAAEESKAGWWTRFMQKGGRD